MRTCAGRGAGGGRWEQARKPTRRELKATAILAVSLDEASAKIAAGGPDDGETEDAELDVRAGHVPIRLAAGEPVRCRHLRPDIQVPDGIARYQRRLDGAA